MRVALRSATAPPRGLCRRHWIRSLNSGQQGCCKQVQRCGQGRAAPKGLPVQVPALVLPAEPCAPPTLLIMQSGRDVPSSGDLPWRGFGASEIRSTLEMELTRCSFAATNSALDGCG